MPATDYRITEGLSPKVVITVEYSLDLPDEKVMSFAEEWVGHIVLEKKLSHDNIYHFFVTLDTDNTETHFDYDEQDKKFDTAKAGLFTISKYNGNYLWGAVRGGIAAEDMLLAWRDACRSVYPKNDIHIRRT